MGVYTPLEELVGWKTPIFIIIMCASYTTYQLLSPVVAVIEVVGALIVGL